VADFTSSVEDVQNKIIFAVPQGRTSLLDAIYMGVAKMKEAHNSKKACSSSPTAATITAAIPRTRSSRW